MGGQTRILHLALLSMLGGGLCVARLVQLQVGQSEFWNHEAVKARTRSRSLPFRRGSILDRAGRPLATTRAVWDLKLQFSSFRKQTDLGRLWLLSFLVEGQRRDLPQLAADADYELARLSQLTVGQIRELDPGTRRADLCWYASQLLGEPDSKRLQARLRDAAPESLFCPELGHAGDLLARLEVETADLQHLESLLEFKPGELLAKIGSEVQKIDQRIDELLVKLLEQQTGEETRPEFIARRDLHRELDYRERVLEREVSYEVARMVRERLQGLVCRERICRVYPEDADVCAVIVGRVGRPIPEVIATRKRIETRISELVLLENPTVAEAEELLAARTWLSEEAYRDEEEVGRDGIEAGYESVLRGRRGLERKEAKRKGEAVKLLERIPPQQGQDVTLTLDLVLQQAAERVLSQQAHPGAFVLVELPEMKVRTLASFPSATRLERGESYKELKELTERGDDSYAVLMELSPAQRFPLHPRAWKPFFPPPPGSVFKPLVASLALSEGVINARTTLPCTHRMMVGREVVRCLGNHGETDIHTALLESCNHYFAHLADQVGFAKVHQWAEAFGFGSRIGLVDTVLESGKHFHYFDKTEPDCKLMERDPGRANLMRFGIGQAAFDDVTPVQLAAAFGALAQREYRRPVLIETVGDQIPVREVPRSLNITDSAYNIVLEAMRGVTLEGTAAPDPEWDRDLTAYDLATKTGTAQAGGTQADHSWFAGFFPSSDPRFAFVVFQEHTDLHGGEAAAPVFKQILALPEFAEIEQMARGEEP